MTSKTGSAKFFVQPLESLEAAGTAARSLRSIVLGLFNTQVHYRYFRNDMSFNGVNNFMCIIYVYIQMRLSELLCFGTPQFPNRALASPPWFDVRIPQPAMSCVSSVEVADDALG